MSKLWQIIKVVLLTLLGTFIILPLVGIGLCIPFVNIFINYIYRNKGGQR